MTIERKRALNEVLLRRHPDGTVGVSIAFLTWMEEDSKPLAETMRLDPPADTDWSDPLVVGFVGDALTSKAAALVAEQAAHADTKSQLAAGQQRIEQLEAQATQHAAKIAELEAQLSQPKPQPESAS